MKTDEPVLLIAAGVVFQNDETNPSVLSLDLLVVVVLFRAVHLLALVKCLSFACARVSQLHFYKLATCDQ